MLDLKYIQNNVIKHLLPNCNVLFQYLLNVHKRYFKLEKIKVHSVTTTVRHFNTFCKSSYNFFCVCNTVKLIIFFRFVFKLSSFKKILEVCQEKKKEPRSGNVLLGIMALNLANFVAFGLFTFGGSTFYGFYESWRHYSDLNKVKKFPSYIPPAVEEGGTVAAPEVNSNSVLPPAQDGYYYIQGKLSTTKPVTVATSKGPSLVNSLSFDFAICQYQLWQILGHDEMDQEQEQEQEQEVMTSKRDRRGRSSMASFSKSSGRNKKLLFKTHVEYRPLYIQNIDVNEFKAVIPLSPICSKSSKTPFFNDSGIEINMPSLVDAIKKKLYKWCKKQGLSVAMNDSSRNENSHNKHWNNEEPDQEEDNSLVHSSFSNGNTRYEHQLWGIRNEEVWTVVGVWDGYNKIEPKEGLFCDISRYSIDEIKSKKKLQMIENAVAGVTVCVVGGAIVYWRWKNSV
ncbi:hypothetical protein RFI_05892 [Reticulomyxa filosa]|uniref:Uncharacterized protein n=1 Tax=Reticulomyxa filosa TaxID=46433 RepID=X6NZB9_RETFI|nr:hypothetical protein RFI_05892 [Reticulomyxa filosa]|eukprot:ETO31228.1 hypothetical protein RFI_05892 [Reticulomyxa filosa]